MRYLFCVFLLINFSFFSQNRFSIGLINSINFSSKDSYIGTYNTQVNPLESSYSLIRGSLGSGYSFGVFFSKTFNSNISLGCEVSRFLGFNSLMYFNDLNNDYQKIYTQLNQNRFSPFISIISKQEKIDFFISTGIIFPISTKSSINSNIVNSELNLNYQIQENLSYNFTWGFSSRLGLQKSLGKHFSTKFDLGFNLLNLTTKSKEIISYQVNGKDEFNSLDKYRITTNYYPNLNNYNNNDLHNTNYDLNKPKEEIQSSQSLSSFLLSLTFSYSF